MGDVGYGFQIQNVKTSNSVLHYSPAPVSLIRNPQSKIRNVEILHQLSEGG